MQVSLNSQNSVFWGWGKWNLFRVCSQLNLLPQMAVALAFIPSFFWWTTKLFCPLLNSEGIICHKIQNFASLCLQLIQLFLWYILKGEDKYEPCGRASIVCQPFYSLSLVFCFACKGCPVALPLASLLCKLLTENSLLALVGVKGLYTEIHFFFERKNSGSNWAQDNLEKHSMHSVKFWQYMLWITSRVFSHLPIQLTSCILGWFKRMANCRRN